MSKNIRNIRDFYKRAKTLVSKQNEQILAAEAECNAVLQDKKYSSEYRSAARQTQEQKTREAVERCEAGMEELQKAFRQAAFAELMPDFQSVSPSLIRALENMTLTPAEVAYLGNDLRAKGDLAGCRLLNDYARKQGMTTQGLYMSPEEAIANYDSYCKDILRYGYGSSDMDPADRGFSDLSDFDSVIDSTWNFGETGENVPEIKVFADEDAEMAAQLHAQHNALENDKQAFLRGWDPASADMAERAQLQAQAQQALWSEGAMDDEGAQLLLKHPETVRKLVEMVKSEATKKALETLLKAQESADSGQDPDGEGAGGAEITSPF